MTLTVLRAPRGVSLGRRTLDGGPFSVGRGSENDWVLTDLNRQVSKLHCTLRQDATGWVIQDNSSFGTFLNDSLQPIGRGNVRMVRDGDRLRLGHYEILARIEADRTELRSDSEWVGRAGIDTPAFAPTPTSAVKRPSNASATRIAAPPEPLTPSHQEAVAQGLLAAIACLSPATIATEVAGTPWLTADQKALAWDILVRRHTDLLGEGLAKAASQLIEASRTRHDGAV